MILNFEDENGAKHFEFIYTGFILGGTTVMQKGLTVLRRELSILDKLESISHVKPCGKKLPTQEPDRQLNKIPEVLQADEIRPKLQVHIDEHEFDLLYSYVGSVPWQTGQPLRDAISTIDWLARAQSK